MFFELHESFDPLLAIFLAGCVTHQHLDLKDSMIWQVQHFAIALVIFQLQESGHYCIYSLEQLVFLEKLR
jgi:hypothetical protein